MLLLLLLLLLLLFLELLVHRVQCLQHLLMKARATNTTAGVLNKTPLVLCRYRSGIWEY